MHSGIVLCVLEACTRLSGTALTAESVPALSVFAAAVLQAAVPQELLGPGPSCWIWPLQELVTKHVHLLADSAVMHCSRTYMSWF